MRKLVCSMFAAAVIVALPGQAEAQGAAIGPTVAWHDDFDFGIGAMADIGVPALAPGVGILADFTYFFPDGSLNYFEINGNLRWEFPTEDMPIVPFALAGLNLARASIDGIDDSGNTEVGLNLGGGLKFNAGTLEPIVGGRFEIDGGEGFVLFGTLPFSLGG